MAKYLSCAETAKLVRAALKEAFPGVKFGVRSSVYAGGASIRVSYVNGPSYAQVKGVVGAFEGAYFDGMTDYKGSNYNTLDGEDVSFGADFIFVERTFTVGYLEGFVDLAVSRYGYPKFAVTDSGFGARIVGADYTQEKRIMELASEFSLDDAAESKTLKRVAFKGDDGYGYGAVGRLSA